MIQNNKNCLLFEKDNYIYFKEKIEFLLDNLNFQKILEIGIKAL